MSPELRYTDSEWTAENDDYTDWAFRLGGASESTQTLLGVNEEDGMVGRLSVGNWVWETRTVTSRAGMRQEETRRGRVAALRECQEGIVALVDFGRALARVDARAILTAATSESDSESESLVVRDWRTEAPEGMDGEARRMTRWIDVQEASDIPEIESVNALSFEKIEGTGSRIAVNHFLEGSTDGTVDHDCGGVHHWKAAFVAKYEGDVVAALVLAPPQNGVLAASGEEIVISRIACHPSRPPNTSTWMIGHARDWAEREGYSRISSLAGVGGNRGSCYRGAGFTLDDETPDYIDGSGNQWHRRRYVYELEPERFEGRDPPMPGVDYGMQPQIQAQSRQPEPESESKSKSESESEAQAEGSADGGGVQAD